MLFGWLQPHEFTQMLYIEYFGGILCLAHLSHGFHSKRTDCFNLNYFHEEPRNKCFGKKSEMERDKIVSIKYLIRVEGRYDCCRPASCRMEEWGHLWYSTGKGKAVFQRREDNADHFMLCQQLAPNKFKMEILKKKESPNHQKQLLEQPFSCRSCGEAGTFFRDGDTVTFIKSSGRCWVVCFPVPNFCSSTCYLRSCLQFC